MPSMDGTGVAASDREVELKLAIATPSAHEAAERELAGAPARKVETIYFDTPGRALQAAGYSLRLRRDRGRWRQSVKGLAGLSRFESDCAVADGRPELDRLAGTPVESLLAHDVQVGPVFATRVKRRSGRRATGAGRIEISLDDGEVLADGRSWPIRELELELEAGGPDALFEEGRRLAAREAFVPTFMSKAERGFALADGRLGEPARFAVRPLDAALPPPEAFRIIAQRCLLQLSLNAELVAPDAPTEAVHQARTAIRRLRVALGLFRALLDGEHAAALRTELGWLAGELAPARNLDVIDEELFTPRADQIAGTAPREAFASLMAVARFDAIGRARAALASPRFRLLLLDAVRVLESARSAREVPLKDFAASTLNARRTALSHRLRRLDWRDAAQRHDARIAAKKLRYACDFFVGLGPDRKADAERKFTKSLSRLQDCLGRLNDWVVAEQMTPAIAADDTEASFAAGWILGEQRALSRKRIRAARRAAERWLDAPRWW